MTIPRIAAIVAALAIIMPHGALATAIEPTNIADDPQVERPIGLLLQSPETPTGKPLHGKVAQA